MLQCAPGISRDTPSTAKEITGLKTGVEYTLRETVAPDGYTIAADTKFTIDTDGTVKVGGTAVQNGVVLIEDSLTKVTVSKKAVNGQDSHRAQA